MKIIKLVSENVKRLSAVEITPAGTLVSVGGKNGAGKSSVLDSIAYALGGKELIPVEPIRAGESDAKIVVDLGDFTVTRRFYREKFVCSCTEGMAAAERGSSTPVEHAPDCNSRLLGETKSTLAVTNKDGAKYPSPQKMLDGLLGKLTFDPLAFSREESKKQNETLRQLTSLDFSMLDKTRQTAYAQRAMSNQSLKIAEGKLATMAEHADAPAEVISIDEVSTEIKRGQALQREAEIRRVAVDAIQRILEGIRTERARTETTIEDLRTRLANEEKRLSDIDDNIDAHKNEAEKLVAVADEAKKAVPNFEQLDARLREIDATNTKVRANKARAEQKESVDRLKKASDDETATIEDIDIKKASMLEAAKFPVDGLGLFDDGVTFNDLPLGQASASEQLRISIAIGLALNPTLKVLLIRNGNLLDEDSLKLVADMAAEASAQVWMEFVTSSGEGMTVMMEDGHVRG